MKNAKQILTDRRPRHLARVRGFFDADFYREQNPDVTASGLDPFEHYMQYGWHEGRDPSPDFSTTFYLDRNEDVRAAGMNPLEHWVLSGKAENRPAKHEAGIDEQRLRDAFDTDFYGAQNPDVATSGLDLFRHYMQHGWREGRDPSPDFSTTFYLDSNGDIGEAGTNPFEHWVLSGKAEDRPGKPEAGIDEQRLRDAFDADFYGAQNPDVAASGLDLFRHYMQHGWREGRDPSPDFSTAFYLDRNEDVGISGTNPFEHWVLSGKAEDRPGKPETGIDEQRLRDAFDADFYRTRNPDVAASGLDPFEHYMQHGWREGRDPSPDFSTTFYLDRNEDVITAGANPFRHWVLFGKAENRPGQSEKAIIERRLRKVFDAGFYLAQNPDIAAGGLDPFEHYMQHGWRERRDPSPDFSTAFYLDRNRDIRGANKNPFEHWVLFGKAENRPGKPEPGIDMEAFDIDKVDWESCPEEDIAAIADRFDPVFYEKTYPEVAAQGLDPRKHYLLAGWRLGYNPSRTFSTSYYISRYPDIGRAGLNPFLHYCLHGYKEHRETRSYIERRLSTGAFRPKVTVIVPNYNHAPYLPQRIRSIAEQSYGNIELIILDDTSTDDSRAVIARTVEELGIEARLAFNDVNQGNPFKQWQKGLAMATGDLIWICESDDFCEPDFLERIVPWFVDESVNIAFGRIQFADREGAPMDGLDHYRESAEPGIWSEGLARPAREWFDGALGVNNMIANVGGCVFRNAPIAQSTWEKAVANRICGDWLLYLHIAGCGQIAYEPGAVAYFRQHGANTSGASARGRFYFDEKIGVVREIARYWGTSRATRERFLAGFRVEYGARDKAEELGDFEEEMKVADLMAIEKERKHVQILFLGFQTGGGELFPINLANALLETGNSVSMLALDMMSINDDMRARLDRRIPVYHPSHCTTRSRAGYLDACGIDVVNTHIAGADAFLYSLDRDPIERPYVVTLHGSYTGLEEAAPVPMIDWILENVSRWIYTAERNLEFFEDRLARSEEFIKLPNAMPRDDRPAPFTRADLGIGEDATVFTLIARGIKRKGWRASVEAFRILKERYGRDDIALLLVGDGETATDAQQLVEDLSPVHFLGYQSEINGVLRLSDCLILPSRFEGESYPLCLIQALQEHVPAIATDIGDIRSMMTTDDGRIAGILLENKRKSTAFFDDLATAMDAMCDPEIRRAYAGIAADRAHLFDIDSLAHTYMEVYGEG